MAEFKLTQQQEGLLTPKDPITQAVNDPSSVSAIDSFNQQNFSLDSQVANNQTPQGFQLNVRDNVPSSVLSDGVGLDDVFAKRAELEAQGGNDLTGIGEVGSPTPFDDPEAFIRDMLFSEQAPTDTQREAAAIRSDITRTTEGITSGLDETTRRAERTTGLSDLQAGLAETNNKIAQRQARFRRELREFKQDATQRGVAREFVQRDLAKMEADATAELADLYIIQNAQSGNVEAARDYINTAVTNKYRSIEAELNAQQARLNEVIPRLEGEEKQNALKLQLALNERQANIETEKEAAATMRELGLQAASNGASSSVVNSIINSKDINTALTQASPYIGLLQRQAANRAAASANLARRKTLIELAMAGDKAAIAELGDYGAYLAGIKGDAEAMAREQEFQDADEKITLANQISDNKLGLELNTGGIFQKPWVAGLAVFSPLGFAARKIGIESKFTQTPLELKRAKEDFQADIKSLVAPEALDELVRRKEAGATFGALSNQELALLTAASQQLAGHVLLHDDGTVSLIGSPDAIQSDLNKVIGFYQKAQRGVNQSELDNSEFSQINSLFE